MKIPASRRQHGFTLVELLVVIAIIAILASIGFGVGNMAIQKAKRTKCLAVCTGIEGAVNGFFTDYGILPTSTTASAGSDDSPAISTTEADGIALVTVLLGMENTLNTRSVKYLTVKEGKNNKDGVIYTGDTAIQGLYDPWGGPYWVQMDTNYDEMVKPKPKAANATVTLHGRRVAVWSNGADAATGADGKTADDVITW